MITEPTVEEIGEIMEQWRADLRALFAQVREWAKEMDPVPVITQGKVSLNEHYSGPYEADELVLTAEGRQMRVRPRARWMLGGDGLVDLVGPDGPFHLVDVKEQGGWHYLGENRFVEHHPLDGPSFRDLASVFFT